MSSSTTTGVEGATNVALNAIPVAGAGLVYGEQRVRLMALQFVSGSLAACGAVTITNPFDMLKTRRQLLNELNLRTSVTTSPTKVVPRTMATCAATNTMSISSTASHLTLRLVWRAEGLGGLQRGLLPAYVYQVLMNGTRFMVYEPLRQWFLGATGFPSHSLVCNAGAGAVAGGLAALIGSPFNLIKTRLQSFSPVLPTGYQHGYGGIWEAMRRISASEGLMGFYRGVGASMSRTTAGSAAQLAAYDWLKPAVAQASHQSASSLLVHCLAAMGSGVLACVVMNPFDVVMTRLYNQQTAGALYTGLLDCAQKTVAAEGVAALYGRVWCRILCALVPIPCSPLCSWNKCGPCCDRSSRTTHLVGLTTTTIVTTQVWTGSWGCRPCVVCTYFTR